MPLLVCGINHQSAPLTVREKLVFTTERTPLALQSLLAEKAINEALLLSTCNRTEIYTTVDEARLFSVGCQSNRNYRTSIFNLFAMRAATSKWCAMSCV